MAYYGVVGVNKIRIKAKPGNKSAETGDLLLLQRKRKGREKQMP